MSPPVLPSARSPARALALASGGGTSAGRTRVPPLAPWPAAPSAAWPDGAALPLQRQGALTRAQLGVIGLGALLLHGVAAWALWQLGPVRPAVVEVAPLLVTWVPVAAAPSPPPPPQQPQPRPPQAAPVPAPAPVPVLAAAPSPSPAPAALAVEPTPTAAPPAPVALPAAPSAVAAPAPPAPPAEPRQIPPSAVRYLKLPELNFPPLARRARQSGTVVLRITVDASGRLQDVRIHSSSGHERIDQAALQDIRTARFAPYLHEGKPVEVQTLATLGYDL